MSDLSKEELGAKTILIIDDDESVRSFMAFSLKGEGFNILEAGNGERALTILKTEVPDLILADIMMPRIDGFTLCKKIRSDSRLSQVPVIFITANTDPDRLERTKEVGAQGFLEKPIMFDELMMQVLDALNGKFSLPTRFKFASGDS